MSSVILSQKFAIKSERLFVFITINYAVPQAIVNLLAK